MRVSGFCGLRSGERFTTEKQVSCVTNTFFSNFRANFFFFFQLSSRKKSGKQYFAAKRSGRTNFRTQNFWPKKISGRTSGTRSVGSVFGDRYHARRETCNNGQFSQLSRRSFRNFSARMFVQAKKFRDNCLKKSLKPLSQGYPAARARVRRAGPRPRR